MKSAEAISSNEKILTPLRTLKELLRFVIPVGNKIFSFDEMASTLFIKAYLLELMNN